MTDSTHTFEQAKTASECGKFLREYFKRSRLETYSLAPPTPTELFELLKNAQLPPPIELAKIAATVGPVDNPRKSLENAVWLYLNTLKFHETFTSATQEQRCLLCGQFDLLYESKIANPEVKLGHFWNYKGTVWNAFLESVVKMKTPADSTARIRKFFQSLCPGNDDPKEFSTNSIEYFKSISVTNDNWQHWSHIADAYSDWWREQKSKQARESADRPRRPKKKRPNSKKNL